MRTEKEADRTPVIFRKWKGSEDVFALFPTIPADVNGQLVLSYEHIGQHGAASLLIISETTPASEAEYADLKDELEKIGYDLVVYRRHQRWMDDERCKEVRDLNSEKRT